ncbi:MAG: hypothetical protein JWP19_1179 [Rhodoglobus sp.]|nr:hypothetical protein [Rhodoglobus sp.]
MDRVALFNNTAEYEVPVDPMDDLQCDSCQ